ncbi:MAG TPA: DUF1569 domain-containing protein [Gemmatimonadales bacterium]|nr:DUF1569 domain-containing protein [Gemmatimonadales bacterium]
MSKFSDLPDIVLGSLKDHPEVDWYRAPEGHWCSAQIVEHLALGLQWSAAGFEDRRARDPMVRRPLKLRERLARVCIMDLGFFPPFLRAPERSIPPEKIERQVAEEHFRTGCERIQDIAKLLLPARSRDLFVKHPRMGDLTLPEWMDFHVRHARHHAKQIRKRIAG